MQLLCFRNYVVYYPYFRYYISVFLQNPLPYMLRSHTFIKLLFHIEFQDTASLFPSARIFNFPCFSCYVSNVS
jgi:hypothetical protein